MKYCAVATTFRGVRVYTRSAMGMPGSETALEEIMCRVLGDLVQEGHVAKLADDLYCGAESLDVLLATSATCASSPRPVQPPALSCQDFHLPTVYLYSWLDRVSRLVVCHSTSYSRTYILPPKQECERPTFIYWRL